MPTRPIVIATWPFGLPACDAAWERLSAGSAALDAAIAGASQCEDDPSVNSVGFGGLPDASGEVTLDACVMNHTGRCGAVACMKRVRHAARAARLVMERTPHVLLAGEAATQFAIDQGLPEESLLTPQTAQRYAQWKQQGAGAPEGHDTLGILALDAAGELAGVCTTSGLSFKLPGRVGDSPIIGAGLFVDGAVGAATATGVGEEVIKCCGSFAIVENLRRGIEPAEAIKDVLARLLHQRKGDPKTDVSFLALRIDGAWAGMSLRTASNFQYAVIHAGTRQLTAAPTLVQ